AKAVEANTLAVLGWNVNYRDSDTGLVPDFQQLNGRNQQSNWPTTGNASETMTWEVAHHPAAGLMAMVCRPSPVYIETAQKVAAWNGAWSSGDGNGVFGHWYQTRGKAWCLRSLSHAILMTPDTMNWRAAAIGTLNGNVAH